MVLAQLRVTTQARAALAAMATGGAAAASASALLGPPPRARRLPLQPSPLSPNISSTPSLPSISAFPSARSPTLALGPTLSFPLLPSRRILPLCAVAKPNAIWAEHDASASLPGRQAVRHTLSGLLQGAEGIPEVDGNGNLLEDDCGEGTGWLRKDPNLISSPGLSRRSALLILAGGSVGAECAEWLPLSASPFSPPLDAAAAAEAAVGTEGALGTESSGSGPQATPDGAPTGRQKASRGEKERDRPRAVSLEEGVQLITFREGSGAAPQPGNVAVLHYKGRLGAKQGWIFDSTFEHKDEYGGPEPFEFVVGSPKVIKGLSIAVSSMKAGGIARAIIPPPVAYQSTEDEPLPPNFFDRQRLFTTVFNPTRLRNGEQDTLGTIVFDIQLLSVRVPAPVPQG